MKRASKYLILNVALMLLLLSIGTNVNAATKLNKTNATILVRGTIKLELKGTHKKIKWGSENSTIASVDQKGVVTAKSPGNTKIFAKVGNAKYTCNVKVKTDIYKTVTLSFHDIDSWIKSVNSKEMALTFTTGGKYTIDDNTYSAGNIIRSREVISYKTVKTKVSLYTPGYYKNVEVKLPYKIKYRLHRHWQNIVGGSEGFGTMLTGLVEGSIKWKQKCSCGLSTELSWDAPISEDILNSASGITVNSKDIVSYQATSKPVHGANTVSSKFSINKSSIILYPKMSFRLRIKGKSKKGNVTWKSTNPSKVIVNSKGKVTAKKICTATIIAKSNRKVAKCKVIVKKPTIKIDKSKVILYILGTNKIKLNTVVEGSSRKVVWKSSNKKIASVNSKGEITAKNPGSVTISAKANGVIAKCKVIVKKEKATKNVTTDLLNKRFTRSYMGYDETIRFYKNKNNETVMEYINWRGWKSWLVYIPNEEWLTNGDGVYAIVSGAWSELGHNHMGLQLTWLSNRKIGVIVKASPGYTELEGEFDEIES